jgi:hypothetical protein
MGEYSMPKAQAFENAIPHEMRFKMYDWVNDGKDLYWITQEFFTEHDLAEFAKHLDIMGCDTAYVTVRDLSQYDYDIDTFNDMLAVAHSDGSYDIENYKSACKRYIPKYYDELFDGEFFDISAFEEAVPHKMRPKYIDDVYDSGLYWVTQEPFSEDELREFADLFSNMEYYDVAYVTVRDFSCYDFNEDKHNKVLAVVHKDGSYEIENYKNKCIDRGWLGRYVTFNSSKRLSGKQIYASDFSWDRLHRMAELVKEQYPEGTRVEVISMGDDPNPIPSGTRGTVSVVDDIGTVFCDFDNGRHLGLIYGEDNFRKLTDEEIAEEQ